MTTTAGQEDTIAAIATPAGTGGLGVVRISGPDAGSIAAGLLGVSVEELPDRRLVRGVVRDREGARVDDVLAVVMRAPHSYTGEEVAELHGHGGALNIARLLRQVLAAGARAALPGEFTRRAFANQKLDLTAAEAVLGVIEAGSERAWRVAQAQLAGELGERVRGLRARATELCAEVEAWIDFPEEDIDVRRGSELDARADALGTEVARLAATFALGKALRQGIEVAIVGPVNAGKSSLFNRLLGEERAIVTPEPGTTRDWVEGRAVWDGVPVTLIDTAGERDAARMASDAERRGVELGRKRAAAADLRLVVHAAPETPREVTSASGELHVVTKGDLLVGGERPSLLITSAETGDGIEALRGSILATVVGDGDADEGVVVTSERQRTLLDRASSALGRAAIALRDDRPLEVAALELRDAAGGLAEILGERIGEEMLDALFARFCIGK
jgi:tRNA modification GTPase